MKTQQNKSVTIREVVRNAITGQPINIPTRELFECSDIDIDDDRQIIDEYSDPLEVEGVVRQIAEDNHRISVEREKEEEERKKAEKEKNNKKVKDNEEETKTETKESYPENEGNEADKS